MQSVLGRALPIFTTAQRDAARSGVVCGESDLPINFIKGSIALLCVSFALLTGASTAFAGATQTVVYCGDPVDIPNCSPGASSNYDWDLQSSILSERSLTTTGQFVWAGEARYGHGFIPGGNPINGSNNSGVDHQILTNYSDPVGDIDNTIYGLAYDAASNTLFIADTDNNRVVAYSRGSFDAAGASPGAYPVDFSRGGQVGSVTQPRGMSFNAFTGQLVVADYGGKRINRYAYTPGDRVSAPPAGGPALTYQSSFGSADWSDDGRTARDVATDPTNGHSFVAIGFSQDEVQEYDENGANVRKIATGVTGPGTDVRAVALDPDARLLYIAKASTIEVVSLSTGNKLGNLNFGFDVSAAASIVDIDVDPIAHTLYVVTSQAFAADATQAPVAGYQLDPPPACTPQAVTVAPGSSRTIVPNCTDVDGGTIEYSVVGAPSAGSAESLADRSALSYTASAQPATTNIPFRARSLNGRTTTFNQPVTIASSLTPVVRQSANLEPVSGAVQIKLPGSDKWIPLTEATLIPVGTIIDARNGKAHLTFANADGTTQDGTFWDGIFQVSQGSGAKPIVTLKLRDDLVTVPAAKSSAFAAISANPFEAVIARRRGRKKNGLWGDAHGKYKTSGKGGSAAVRGTRWYVADYKYGSLFKVARGVVEIDPIRGKNFNLKAGKQFFIFYKKG